MTDSTAARLGPGELVYLAKVRQAMRRLGSQEPEPENIRQAVQSVRDLSSFDVEVPTASRRREFEMVKSGIKRLSVWYMRYLAGQLNAFAASVSRMGDAMAARVERVEATTDEVLARVGAAEERLARLEAAAQAGAPVAPGVADELVAATGEADESYAAVAGPPVSAPAGPAPAASRPAGSRPATPKAGTPAKAGPHGRNGSSRSRPNRKKGGGA